MEQQRYEKGTWHGKPTWNCLGCHGTFFSEEEWEAHWNANHVKEVTLRPTGLVDPKGREIVVEQDDELEEWVRRSLEAQAKAEAELGGDVLDVTAHDDPEPRFIKAEPLAGLAPLELDDDE